MSVFSCGRSLYIDRRVVVVVGGECSTHVKGEGELSGRGNVRGTCPGGNVRIPNLQKLGRVRKRLHSDGLRRAVGDLTSLMF